MEVPLIVTEVWAADRVGRLFDSLADAHASSCESGRLAPVDEWIRQHLAFEAECRAISLALDLGCGTGFWAQQLVDAGYRLRLVDSSERMLSLARERFQGSPIEEVEFVHGDAVAAVQSDAIRYGVVLMLGELTAYVESVSELLAAVNRVVHPEGIVLGSYMRAEGLLPRLSDGEVLMIDGDELIFCERSGLGSEGPLFARAHSDESIVTLLRQSGFDVVGRYKDASSPRGAFVARPYL